MTAPARRGDFRALENSFVKKLIAHTLAPGDPLAYAMRRWGNDAPVYNEKTAVPGTGTVGGAFATESTAVFNSIFEASVPGRMTGLRRVPINARVVNIATGATASWVREGQGKPITRMTLDATPLEARKCVAVIVVSDEVLRDGGAAGEALLRSDLQRAASDAVSTAFLSTSADDGETPGGILYNLSAVIAGSNVGGSLDALLADFDGDLTRAVWIGSPGTLAFLSATYWQAGLRGGLLLGAPVISTRFLPSNTLVLVDPAMIALADSGLAVKSAKNASVQMESAPTQSAFDGSPLVPTASNVISLFQVDATAIAVEVAINWKATAGAVSVLDTTAWSGTSP
jgi:hypothetical protein